MCLAVPGQILSIHDDRGTPMATFAFGGIRKDICLAFLPEATVGDYAIVHAGCAIALVDEASAHATLALLAEAELHAELGPAPEDAVKIGDAVKIEDAATIEGTP